MKCFGSSQTQARRRGAVAVIVTVCLVPLIGVMAMVLDGGLLMGARRQAQAAADATAHAAACSLYRNFGSDNGSDPHGTAKTAALAMAAANGYANDGTTSVVTLNIPPLAGNHVGQAGYAEAVVTYNQARMFSALWGSSTIPVTARAVARGMLAPYSNAALIVLDPSSASSLSMAGSGRVIASSAIQVNSTNIAAVNANNAGYAKAPLIDITGHYTTSSSGYLSGTVQTSAPAISNPLSKISAPSTSGLTTQGSIPGYGSYTMNPGIYNGGVSIGGGMTIKMNPGTYYMKNGGFSIANGASVTGNGVMVYVDNGGGQISFQGGGVITMSPPTSGTYAGIVLFQDPNSTKPISVANGSTTSISGTVYAPNAIVSFAGGASASQYGSQFICKQMHISNNADIRLNWGSSSVAKTRALGLVE